LRVLIFENKNADFMIKFSEKLEKKRKKWKSMTMIMMGCGRE
jgi:hypothetical protein